MSDDVIFKMQELATKGHEGKFRKWSDGVPYIVHPFRVATKVAQLKGVTWVDICAALGHDLLEDTEITAEEIREVAGDEVLTLIQELTNPSSAPEWENKSRKEKRAVDYPHLAKISKRAQRIKLVDRIDNLSDNMNVKFMKEKYLPESREIAEILKAADEELHKELLTVIDKLEASL